MERQQQKGRGAPGSPKGPAGHRGGPAGARRMAVEETLPATATTAASPRPAPRPAAEAVGQADSTLRPGVQPAPPQQRLVQGSQASPWPPPLATRPPPQQEPRGSLGCLTSPMAAWPLAWRPAPRPAAELATCAPRTPPPTSLRMPQLSRCRVPLPGERAYGWAGGGAMPAPPDGAPRRRRAAAQQPLVNRGLGPAEAPIWRTTAGKPGQPPARRRQTVQIPWGQIRCHRAHTAPQCRGRLVW